MKLYRATKLGWGRIRDEWSSGRIINSGALTPYFIPAPRPIIYISKRVKTGMDKINTFSTYNSSNHVFYNRIGNNTINSILPAKKNAAGISKWYYGRKKSKESKNSHSSSKDLHKHLEGTFLGILGVVVACVVIQNTMFNRFKWSSLSNNASDKRGVEDTQEVEKHMLSQLKNETIMSYCNDPNWTKSEDKIFSNKYISKLNILPFTRKVLTGKDRIMVPPVYFVKVDSSENAAFIKFGSDLCGHPGIIHGGMIATAFDNVMGALAVSKSPKNTCFTANLNINYRSPMPANKLILFRSKLERIDNRKIYISSIASSVNGDTVYSEANALFITPKSGIGTFITSIVMPNV